MKSNLLKIGYILNCSTVDWPNKIVSVIFLSGCQFRCPWCQNPDLVLKSGRKLSISTVVKTIIENRKLIDGVVITGGEPTLQKDALIYLCRKFQELNIDVMLDTNGVDTEVINELINQSLLKRISIDFKAPIDDIKLFKKITKTKTDEYLLSFKKTLEISKNWDLEIEYRTTIIPTFNAEPNIIERIAKAIPKCDLYTLQQFSSQDSLLDPSCSEIPSPTPDEMRKLAQIAKKYVENVMIRTIENGEEII